jgi:hypothetical protein
LLAAAFLAGCTPPAPAATRPDPKDSRRTRSGSPAKTCLRPDDLRAAASARSRRAGPRATPQPNPNEKTRRPAGRRASCRLRAAPAHFEIVIPPTRLLVRFIARAGAGAGGIRDG